MAATIVRIREAQSADSPLLGELVEKTLDECLGMVLPSRDLTNRGRAYRASQPNRKCYIAETDGALTGYAVVSTERFETSPCGTIERLYVTHDHLTPQDSHDVAAALVAAARADTAVPLQTANENGTDTTLALYDRWGFVDLEALRVCLNSSSGRWLGALTTADM